MKKLILLFSIIAGMNLFAGEVIPQRDILDRMKPYLVKADVYEKFQEIEAMEALGGEEIETVTADGLETKNTANKGDYIVRNKTKAGERYIIRRDKFSSRYAYLRESKDGWKVYEATGRILGVEVDDEILKSFGAEDEFYFMAPWGQKMIVKEGDYLASPLDYSEIYRIARQEFFETYRKKN